MKEYFKHHENAIIKHLRSEFPYEGVGVIINDKYIPCENVAQNPEEHFDIGKKQYKELRALGEFQAVVHSHNDYPHISEDDMRSQMETLIPYGMVSLKNGSVQRIVWWGDALEPQNLLNRYFIHGVYDCYGLVRDFYRHHGIVIPNFVRENVWWEDNKGMFEQNFEAAGFEKITVDEVKPGDTVLMKIRGCIQNNYANHCGIVLEGNTLLHHLYNRASRIEPIGGWKKCVTTYLRLKEFDGKVNKELLVNE